MYLSFIIHILMYLHFIILYIYASAKIYPAVIRTRIVMGMDHENFKKMISNQYGTMYQKILKLKILGWAVITLQRIFFHYSSIVAAAAKTVQWDDETRNLRHNFYILFLSLQLQKGRGSFENPHRVTSWLRSNREKGFLCSRGKTYGFLLYFTIEVTFMESKNRVYSFVVAV